MSLTSTPYCIRKSHTFPQGGCILNDPLGGRDLYQVFDKKCPHSAGYIHIQGTKCKYNIPNPSLMVGGRGVCVCVCVGGGDDWCIKVRLMQNLNLI